ncbi:hypothetical protein [Streptomyces sp. NPDC002133]|uniref:hypothetical protein n=1 Tax=Streptomyces sp. NPDC002133 TaxID=3154409 RepID=UPI0033204E91
MSRRTFARLAAAPVLASLAGGLQSGQAQAAELRQSGSASAATGTVPAAMRRAAVFMDEHVSYRGAYVWSYLSDLSTTWGEMEARRTMCWVQPPGTPTVGHSMLDAYHATGDEAFYRAAERTGLALVDAQLPIGGWNYIHDFAGEAPYQPQESALGITSSAFTGNMAKLIAYVSG